MRVITNTNILKSVNIINTITLLPYVFQLGPLTSFVIYKITSIISGTFAGLMSGSFGLLGTIALSFALLLCTMFLIVVSTVLIYRTMDGILDYNDFGTFFIKL